MADLMVERIRSIERTAGLAFVLGSLLLAVSLLLYPSYPQVNQSNVVLGSIAKERGESWMQLHAFMAAGFALVTIGFAALAFHLHIKGSSGAASIIGTSALIGGTLWVLFLCGEIYAYSYFVNLYGIDPGGATMLFSTIWFWKLSALVAAALLYFVAVVTTGLRAPARGILPVWLGWGGALFAIVGIIVYGLEFWGSTATGAAIQPMQWPAVRYGVGLPLQAWLLGVGAVLLRSYYTRAAYRTAIMEKAAARTAAADKPDSMGPAETPLSA
jgi:hypothetical protein